MRKQLYLLFLLLLSVQLTIAQTARYEYWLDNGYQGRTVVANNVTDVALNLDISSLKPGLHYFSVRAQSTSGQWGGLSRYLFFVREEADPNASAMTKYEYWLDNSFSERTTVNGLTSDVALNLDISNLKPGLHYFNVRAQGQSGQWGGLSRYLFFVREEANPNASAMTKYEYWLDNSFSERTTVNGVTSDVALNLDISNLKPGLHYFNVRAQGQSGQWGGLSRYLFFVKEESGVNGLSSVEYWFDDRQNVKTEPVTGDEMVLTVDISGLPGGTHTFYLEGIGNNGSRSLMDAYEFTVEAGEAEPYAVLSENNTVLTFYYDDLKVARNGMSVGPFSSWSDRGWDDYSGAITEIEFDASFTSCTSLTSTAYWFYECNNLTTITGIENLKTDNVVDMHNMFSACRSLTSLDVSGFKTDNVTDMDEMFSSCTSLTSLNVSGFRTDNVTGMFSMFMFCSNLTNLDVSGFKTDNVMNMGFMFGACSSLTNLDVSGFKTDNVTNMVSMFASCSGLTTLDVSHFNTEKVTEMKAMFYNCSGLTSLDVTSFNTQKVTDMSGMFGSCSGLTTIYAGSDWSTASVTNGDSMFTGCTSLVGGKGTTFDENHIDYTYARIDGGPNSQTPGYFTDKNAPVVGNPEPYAVLSENNTVVTFYYDDKKEERGGIDINNSYIDNHSSSPYSTATTAVFDASFAAYLPTSSAYWFERCSSLTNIIGMENLKTDNVTDMRYMFYNCSGLTSLDLSKFNTQNVTSMGSMFRGCSSLTSLDLSNFNTQNVTDMSVMFSGCSGLTSLYVTNFDTQNVISMDNMFSGCSGLTSLNVTNFNTQNVINMTAMFEGCSSLTSLDVTNFNTQNVTGMSGMFQSCSGLTSLDVTNFNTQNVMSMSGMFNGCSGLKNLDVTNFNTQNVTIMRQMFYSCSGLTTIYAGSEWSTANVTTGEYMFTNCSNLVGGAGTHFDANHTDYTYARIDGGPNSETPGYFTRSGEQPWVEPGDPEPYAVLSDNNTVLTFYYDTHKEERNGMGVGPYRIYYSPEWYEYRENITSVVFDTSFSSCSSITSTAYWFREFSSLTSITGIHYLNTANVTDMGSMFSECSALTSLDVSKFNTENVTNMREMFEGCSGLTSLDLSGFNTANVIEMGSMFQRCLGLTTLDVSNFNTDNVRTMWAMFFRCSGLTNLDVRNFKTDNVTDMSEMFLGCSSLTSLDLSNFNTQNVTNMQNMFQGCYALASLDISSFNTDNVTNMSYMFHRCNSLTDLDISSFNTANVTDMYYMFCNCWNLITLDLSNFKTSKVTNMGLMFYGCESLTSLDLSSFNTANVTEINGMFSGCSSLASIIAGNANIPAEEYAHIQNPNLLVYVNEARLAPQGVQNVVVNGVAQEIVLTDAEGNNNWFCPQEFRAEKISYSREFKQRTQIGVSRGWESIALPFAVETITHEQRGQIAPFGNDASGLHFWLRRLGHNGLASSQQIEANTPYVISMPNTDEYPERYNLSGRVTFSAENVTVPMTEPVMDETNDLVVLPTFLRMAVNEDIYALNVGDERNGHPEGSIFERNYRAVHPFEVYTLHLGTGPAPQYFALDDLTDGTTSLDTIQSSKIKVQSENEWFTLDGRKLQNAPTAKGVYILNGNKVIVK